MVHFRSGDPLSSDHRAVQVDQLPRSFDNSKPRDPAFYDDPLRARALGAHQNGIEAFPFFAAAVLLAEFRGAPQNLINELAVLFVIVRIAYVLTYVGNRPTLALDPLEHRLRHQCRDLLPAAAPEVAAGLTVRGRSSRSAAM